MDVKKRCSVALCLFAAICVGLWLLGSKEAKDGALPILIRVTIFLGLFRLAYDDLLKILNYLKGPRAILLGIALIGIVAFGKAALPLVGISIGMVVLLTVFNIFQRNSPNQNKKKTRS
ncbi:MAG: hypothetical protein CMJ76_14405 [Planctomycetaceae bacterium]|nr:hypothetical protein [Planctomycetaceae bacterium]|tara:strand:+ start:1590 stop:1943 length:354 start_codon:yes stop_codon:yes gene_type:complete